MTEHRLDALEKKVDEGFASVDERFNRLETRTEVGFAQLNDRFEKMDERFHALNRTLLWGAIAVIVALIGCAATLAAVAMA